MPLPETLRHDAVLTRVAADALADPEGWSFYLLKTELLKRLSPRQAQAAFGEFLADLGPVQAGSGPLFPLCELASRQPLCMIHSPAETLQLAGALLPGSRRSPAFSLQARALFVTRLQDVTTYGRSHLRQVDGVLVSDIQGNEAKRYRTNWWFDPMICGNEEIDLLYHVPIESGQLELSEAIDLTGVFSIGWGHTVLEFVPQLLLADAIAQVAPDVPLLVDANLPAQCYELFRFISPTRAQVRLGFRQGARVQQLWAGSSPEYWPALRATFQSLRADLSSIHPQGLASLLQHAPRVPDAGDPAMRRLFLARSGDKRLSNQDAVITHLEARGFVCVYPERLSLREQLSLVQNATHVAGAWGSQMMLSLLLGHPELRVLLMCGPDLEEGPSLAITAEARGQHVVVLQCPMAKRNAALPYNSLYEAALDALDSTLSDWL